MKLIQSCKVVLRRTHALDRGGVRGDMKEAAHNLIDRIAISKGLPEWEGHYGFNPETLEFNKPI